MEILTSLAEIFFGSITAGVFSGFTVGVVVGFIINAEYHGSLRGYFFQRKMRRLRRKYEYNASGTISERENPETQYCPECFKKAELVKMAISFCPRCGFSRSGRSTYTRRLADAFPPRRQ